MDKIHSKLVSYIVGQNTRGLYHKTFIAVIYGFRNKLECLSLNTRLGWQV